MRLFPVTLFFLAALILLSCCKSAIPAPPPPVVIKDSEPVLYKNWSFLVGAAAPAGAFEPSNKQYPLLRQFNALALSAENDKPFELVNYALANNIKIRGNALIKHNQNPEWFISGGDTKNGKNRVTKDQLYARMENHIKTVFEKYGGGIEWWDVCSEVTGSSGPRSSGTSLYTAVMEEAGLRGINRYEYVLKSFQWARQYADANGGQNVKLYLSDSGAEVQGGKQSELSRLADWLIENGAPIDGIALQCHITWDWPTAAHISKAIDLFSSKTKKDGEKLTVQISELDISLFSSNETSFESGRILLTLPELALENRQARQSEKYRALFDIFEQKHKEGKLDMAIIWGLSDGESPLNAIPAKGRTDYPLLFDRNYKPKEAYRLLILGFDKLSLRLYGQPAEA